MALPHPLPSSRPNPCAGHCHSRGNLLAAVRGCRVDQLAQQHRKMVAGVEMVRGPLLDLTGLNDQKGRNIRANRDRAFVVAALRLVLARLTVEQLLAGGAEGGFEAHRHLRGQGRVAIEEIREGGPTDAELLRGFSDGHAFGRTSVRMNSPTVSDWLLVKPIRRM